MWKYIAEKPRTILFSLLLHVLLFVLILVGVSWEHRNETPRVNIVKAVAVSEASIQQEIELLEKAEQQKNKNEQEELKKLQAELDKVKKQKQKEQDNIKDIQKKRKLEERKRKLEEQKHKEAESKRKAEEKKRQAALAKRKVEEKKAQEATIKREKEEAELAKKRAEEKKREAELAEKKKKEEALKKIKAAEAKKRKYAEDALKAQLAEEEQLMAEQRERIALSKVQKYTAVIRQRVESRWLIPPSSANNRVVTIIVNLIPGGDVSSVVVAKSSGDAIFDRSVEQAIYKAAPFPLPTEAGMFERFRVLRLKFSEAEINR